MNITSAVSASPDRSSRLDHLWKKAASWSRRGESSRAGEKWMRLYAQARRFGAKNLMEVAKLGMRGDSWVEQGPPVTPRIRVGEGRPEAPVVLRHLGIKLELGQSVADSAVGGLGVDMVVDAVRESITIHGQTIAMHGRDIPFKLLIALLKGGPVSIDKQVLFEAAWGRRFNPVYDKSTFYFNIFNLRKWLGTVSSREVLQSTPNGYSIDPSLKVALIERGEVKKKTDRRCAILDIIRVKGYIDNRSLREVTSASRATVLRELQKLVQDGQIERVGWGRRVHYRIAGSDVTVPSSRP